MSAVLILQWHGITGVPHLLRTHRLSAFRVCHSSSQNEAGSVHVRRACRFCYGLFHCRKRISRAWNACPHFQYRKLSFQPENARSERILMAPLSLWHNYHVVRNLLSISLHGLRAFCRSSACSLKSRRNKFCPCSCF